MVNDDVREPLLGAARPAATGEIEEAVEDAVPLTESTPTTPVRNKIGWNWGRQRESAGRPDTPFGSRRGLARERASEDEARPLGGWLRIGKDAWRRRVSIAFICFIVLVGDGNRGLVLPTLQGYLGKFGGTSSELGIANAGFSAGRLVAAPIYGYWIDKRNTGEVVLFSMVICALCNFLYTYASYVKDINKYASPAVVIVVSRTILGFGASILGVGRAYIAKQTSKAERGPYIAILCALQYAGFTLTAFISVIDFEGIQSLDLTKYNLPGFVLTLSYVFGIILILVVPSSLFDSEAKHQTNTERPKACLSKTQYTSSSYPYLMQLEKSASSESVKDMSAVLTGFSDNSADNHHGTRVDVEGRNHSPNSRNGSSPKLKRSSTLKKLLTVPGIVVVFILLNFTVRAVLATLETLSTYIISYLYTGSVSEKVWQADGAPTRVAETFTCIGIGGLVVFAGVYYLSGHFPDRSTLLVGLGFILIGLGCTLDFNDGKGLGKEMSLLRFESGLALVWAVGYPLSQTVVVSALSKVLSKDQQGLWMGNLASAGSAGRIVAPTIAGYVYNALHEHTGLVPLLGCFCIAALSIALVLCTWKKLKSTD